MDCPVCSSSAGFYTEICCKDFYKASISDKIEIGFCWRCGHLFNIVDENKLNEFYKEYSQVHNVSTTKGNTPGKLNNLAKGNYKKLFNFIRKNIKLKSGLKILDVGCAQGGFLKYLSSKGKFNLYGTDYVVPKSSKIKFLEGTASELPYPDNFFDIVILDQVLEHVHDLQKAVIEIKRVTKGEGLIVVNVPNMEKYCEYNRYPNFWFLIKEHIQHFNMLSMLLLFNNTNFEFLKVEFDTYSLMNKQIQMPVMMFCFKKFNLSSYVKLTWSDTMLQEKLQYDIKEVMLSYNTVFAWGISKEFFYAYANTDLNKIKNLVLIDKNTYKVKELKFEGKNIVKPSKELFKNSDKFSVILIFTAAYFDEIKKEAIKLGFKGDIIKV